MLGTADGASAWANNEVGIAWIEKAIHKPPKVPQIDFIRTRICVDLQMELVGSAT